MRYVIILGAVICAVAAGVQPTSKAPVHHVKKHAVEEIAHTKAGEIHDDRKHTKKVGKQSKHHDESAHKGNHDITIHKIDDEEKGGKKSTSHAEGGHQSHKKASAHQEHGGKHADGGKHKKTAFTKAFHEKYHKNEHKKHDTFYSHGKKSGDWKTYGIKNSKHGSHSAEKVEHQNKMALKSGDTHGKVSKKASGHSTSDHKAHKAEKGKKSHFDKQQKWAKKHQKPEDSKHKYKYISSTKH